MLNKKKIRYKLIKYLLTDDEKYLLIRALDSRMDELEKYSLAEKTVIIEDVKTDIDDYDKFRGVFSVDGSWL